MALTPTQKASYQAEYDRLRALVSRGATQVVVDGQSVTFDLEVARQRMGELQRLLNPGLRPRAASINLGGF